MGLVFIGLSCVVYYIVVRLFWFEFGLGGFVSDWCLDLVFFIVIYCGCCGWWVFIVWWFSLDDFGFVICWLVWLVYFVVGCLLLCGRWVLLIIMYVITMYVGLFEFDGVLFVCLLCMWVWLWMWCFVRFWWWVVAVLLVR